MIDLVKTIARIKRDDNADLARILILLRAFGGKEGTEPFDGLTKLAKLDFLLRYPRYLERALEARKIDPSKAHVNAFERSSIEATMIRFHYGPWDPKHRHLINLLAGMDMVRATEGSTTQIELTEVGVRMTDILAEEPLFHDNVDRAVLLKRHFNKSGTWLKKFIYSTFPEVTTLKIGAEISYEY